MLVLLHFDLAEIPFVFVPTSLLFGMRLFVLYHYILEVSKFMIFFALVGEGLRVKVCLEFKRDFELLRNVETQRLLETIEVYAFLLEAGEDIKGVEC